MNAVNQKTTDQKLDYLIEQFSTLKTDIVGIKSNVSNLKEDVSTLKSDMQFVKREAESHTDILQHLVVNVVSQKEHKSLSDRVTALEQS